MKYLSSIVMAAVLLTASSAIAQDWTYLDALSPHETHQKEIKLLDSKSTIEVYGGNYDAVTGNYDLISCKFIDFNGSVVAEQKNVSHCLANTKPLSIVPWRATVQVTNEENKPITYKLWVHETK
jgi:hypothetical protein